MNRQKEAWERALRGARRTDRVTGPEHQAILSAVRAQPASSAGPGRGVHRSPPAWLFPAAAAALVAALAIGWLTQPAPLEPNPEIRFAELLDERLREPVRQLAAIPETQPLVAELAALESDLRRLQPSWPWDSWISPPESG